jgi:ATP-dependent Clp protease ATP-binding subunit ClpA
MFERYTEPARRVVFFARYEASRFGSAKIESEHVLLGLIREDEKGFQRFFPGSITIEAIRRQVEDQVPVYENTSTTIDIPLSVECKRILSYAAEESAGLEHPHIDVSHLLLGVLREENCLAAQLLRGLGLELVSVREAIRRQSAQAETEPSDAMRLKVIWSAAKPPLPASGVVPDVDTAKRIAEAVWSPRIPAVPSGPIAAQNATLTAGVWIVTGSLHADSTNISLAAFIQKEDGKILRLHMETPGS